MAREQRSIWGSFGGKARATSSTLALISEMGVGDIAGLETDEEFQRVSAMDQMLSSLQQQLSALLLTPLDDTNAVLFAPNITLDVVDDENGLIRASSTRDDLIAISQALVAGLSYRIPQLPAPMSDLMGALVMTTPLFDMLGALDSARSSNLECEIALVMEDIGRIRDNSSMEEILLVRWRWGVLQSGSPSLPGETAAGPDLVLSGESKFGLNLQTEQVVSHTIHSVSVNDVAVPGRVTAETLKTMRSSFRDLQKIPIVKGWLDQSLESNERMEAVREPKGNEGGSIFIANATCSGNPDEQNPFDKSYWIPIDNYSCQDSLLLPRSTQWRLYSAAHQTAHLFRGSMLPILSRRKQAGLSRPMFAPNARLLDAEGNVLLRNNDVQEFFESLAEWRLRTFATWELDGVEVTGWDDVSVLIRVEYHTAVDPLQQSTTKISTRGSDVFKISTVGDALIQQVQQYSVTVGGLDGTWLMRSIVKSFEADRVVQLPVRTLERLALLQSNTVVGPESPKGNIARVRTDAAALTIYRVMESLHRDFRDLFAADDAEIPAGKYLASDVQFHGYLDNTLLSGRKTYLVSFGWMVKAVSQAVNSQMVRLRSEPTARVEFKLTGNVACKTEFGLDLSPILASLPLLSDQATSISTLNVSIESEYTMCDVTGEILCHKLIATRINGYLAPPDVLARAFKITREKAAAEEKFSWIGVLTDLLLLVKSS